MKKVTSFKVLMLSFVLAFTLSMSVQAGTSGEEFEGSAIYAEDRADDADEVSPVAYSTGGVLYVEAKTGDRIEVYSLLGSLLYSGTVTESVTEIRDLPLSVVIVRVNDAATKVVVR